MTIQTAFRLDRNLVDKLKKYCEREGRSQTWVANKALGDYLGLTKKETAGIIPVIEKKPAVKAVKVIDDSANTHADVVINVLNQSAGTNYRHTDTNRKLINSRLKDYSVSDICHVIDKKCREWKGGEMARYLRPSTLFNATKFEEYLNQNISEGSSNGQNRPKQHIKETPLERMERKQKSMDMRSSTPEHYGQIVGENDTVISTQMGIDRRGLLE
tara:strand:- start:592 stop:1236 length:645 start_codon:yes stop_codon:yes gene_type:complete